MSYNLATVTNAGNKLFNTIVDDNTKLVIDRVEVSATQLDSSTDLKSMTSIDSIVQTLPVNGVSKGDSSIIVKTVLDNKDIKNDYKAWVFGIWGHDQVANVDTLVAVVTTTATPDTVPAYDPGSTIGLKYSFGIVYSNTAKISILQANDQYALNDDVVHISGDESVTGTKTFQAIKIDNDSTKDIVTTDGYNISLNNGKTKFVPADDAKVVHTVDMRQPAGKVASIDEVNAKQDKIGYTPADDTQVVHTSSVSNLPVVFRGTISTVDGDFSALKEKGMYQFGGTNLTWLNGPDDLKGINCWGSVSYWALGGIEIQQITTSAGATYLRIKSGDPSAWGLWQRFAMVNKTPQIKSPTKDFNTMVSNGIYTMVTDTYANAPITPVGGTLYVIYNTASSLSQLFLGAEHNIWFRYRNQNNVWSAWFRTPLMGTDNKITGLNDAQIHDVWLSNIVYGVNKNGANLDNEMTPGIYYSNTTIVGSPFSTQSNYVAWVVKNAENNVVHQTAFTQTGQVADRTWWNGSGWGAWNVQYRLFQASNEADAKSKSTDSDLYFTYE